MFSSAVVAGVLIKSKGVHRGQVPAVLAQVTLLGVSKMIDKCIRGRRQQSKLNPRADYACFEEYHFEPMVVTTQPYEPLSHATLEWLKENQDKCDVLQVCNHLQSNDYLMLIS